jgi:excisionase family DNA binding protein
MSERLAYSLAEAAELSSLSVRSLRYLMQEGKLGFAKVGRRILIPHTELERLIRRASVKPRQALDADEPIRPRKELTNTNASKAATSLASRDTTLERRPHDTTSCE